MSRNFPHPFKDLKKEFNGLIRDMPLLVSALAEQEFVENFQRQGYLQNGTTVNKWKPRLHDQPKDIGRAILIKNGNLWRVVICLQTF